MQGCAAYFDSTSGLPDGFYRVNSVSLTICHPDKNKLVEYLKKQGFILVANKPHEKRIQDIYISHDTYSSVVLEKDWRIRGGRRLLIGKVDWCYSYFVGYRDCGHLKEKQLPNK